MPINFLHYSSGSNNVDNGIKGTVKGACLLPEKWSIGVVVGERKAPFRFYSEFWRELQ